MRRRIARKHGRCPVQGKVMYRTEDDASLAITRAKPKDGKTLPIRVYWHAACGSYHTTSQPEF